jgi:hypothetical protein
MSVYPSRMFQVNTEGWKDFIFPKGRYYDNFATAKSEKGQSDIEFNIFVSSSMEDKDYGEYCWWCCKSIGCLILL